MTPEQFVYWLQGKLEGREANAVTEADVKMILDHLKTIFHKVTPTYIPTVPMPSQPDIPNYFPNQPFNPYRIGDDPNGYPRVIC